MDHRILRSIRRIIRAVDVHSRKLSGTFQLTTPQLITLLCIVDEGPVSLSHISKRVNLSSSTIVGILDRLEAKGLVLRERSQIDRRLVFVHATKKGTTVARSAPSPLQDELLSRLNALPESEQLQLATALERIVELMHAKGLDAAPILEIGDMARSIDPAD